MLKIKTIRKFSDLEALSSQWDRLLEKSGNNNIFLCWTWIWTWTKIYIAEDKLLCIAVYDGDKLAAVAPFWVETKRFAGFFKLKALKFLGSEEVGGNYLDFIIRGKNRKEIIKLIWDQLMGSLADEWDVFYYYQTPVNSRILDQFIKFAEIDDRCLGFPIESYSVCPFVSLPDSWDEFLNCLSANQRRALKVSNQRLSQQGVLELRFCTDQDNLHPEIDRLRDLNRQTWNAKGLPGSFASDNFYKFQIKIADQFLQKGMLFLCSLWLDDKHIGSFYGFDYSNNIYYYIFGIDKTAVRGVNIGRVLLGMCVKQAIKLGRSELDMLMGDEDFKYDWTRQDRRNLNVSIYNRGFGSYAYLLNRFFINNVKVFIKAFIRRNPA